MGEKHKPGEIRGLGNIPYKDHVEVILVKRGLLSKGNRFPRHPRKVRPTEYLIRPSTKEITSNQLN